LVGVVGSGEDGRRDGLAGAFSGNGPDGTRTGIEVGLVAAISGSLSFNEENIAFLERGEFCDFRGD
jgi:hypothetical protein